MKQNELKKTTLITVSKLLAKTIKSKAITPNETYENILWRILGLEVDENGTNKYTNGKSAQRSG